MTKPNLFNHLMQKHTLSENEPIPFKKFENILLEIDNQVLKINSEKQQLENALQLSFEEMQKVWHLINQRENFIKSVLDSSEDIIITLNESGEIIEFNHKAEKVFNLLKNEVLGQPISKIIKNGTLIDDLTKLLKDPSENNELYNKSHEKTIFNYLDEEVPVSVLINKVVSDQTVFYPLYLRDLSTIKKTEIELEKTRAQIVFSSKLTSLGEMAGGIAHEINTPLAIIQMRADQLLEAKKNQRLTDELLNKALLSINTTVVRISKIVKSLRFFARDGSQDQLEEVSLNNIIEDTFSLCREKFNNHGIEMKYTNTSNILIKCRASEISQVLLNLLNNSFDAIENLNEKWIHLEVYIQLNNRLLIQITDSGLGISEEVQQKMMNPFFTTKEIGKGTGLGLSISKGIIESHGGLIYIDPHSQNTKFTIELPLNVSN